MTHTVHGSNATTVVNNDRQITGLSWRTMTQDVASMLEKVCCYKFAKHSTWAANQTLSLVMSAAADCLPDVDAVISADPIRRETCNPAGVGFRRIVEIRPDPDIRPSLSVRMCHSSPAAAARASANRRRYFMVN